MMNKTVNKSKKIRKGDKVVAIAGNYRGQTGTVLSCAGDKVLVQGINIRKKHVKRSEQNPNGGIVELEKPIHVSNLKLMVEGDRAVKLKIRESANGERQLVYQQDGQEVVHRSLKKS